MIIGREVRPQLIVLAADSLNCDCKSAISALEDAGKISSWIIDGGSAIAIEDHEGPLIERDGFSPGDRLVRPVDLALNKVTVPDGFGLYGSFPSSRFFVGFAFPRREEPFRMVSHCTASDLTNVILRLYTWKELGERGFDKVKKVFEEWFYVASNEGFHGEVFRAKMAIKRYSAAERYPLPRELGWEVKLENSNEVFFPWLELFFRLRRSLSKSSRVALQFTNESRPA